mmetsp:Transcript_16562/g.25726  ORF Transcript_16562/g.25726 Transcript_16562/m.25726 type:complete len:210 (+) Transcript_16562:1133-1762(+)
MYSHQFCFLDCNLFISNRNIFPQFVKKSSSYNENTKSIYKNIKINGRGGHKIEINCHSHYQIPFSTKKLIDCSIVINAGDLNLKREDIINEKFLFSPSTTSLTEVEKEIQEIEDDEYRYRSWRNTQVFLALGGSALGMWFAYKGLTALEKWMKEQEQKDIEEEIQMTGTYINPGAEKVEASIDPKTGKKIQIKNDKNKENEDNDSKKNQ